MQVYSSALNSNSVSIQSEAYGMRAYVNSIRGRAQLESEVPDYLISEIYRVWGDTPTATEPVYEAPTEATQQPTTIGLQSQIFDLVSALVTLGAI